MAREDRENLQKQLPLLKKKRKAKKTGINFRSFLLMIFKILFSSKNISQNTSEPASFFLLIGIVS